MESADCIRAAVACCAGVRVRVADLHAWRQTPGALRGWPIAATLLRHADEQTLAGLWAVQQALGRMASTAAMEHWGVVAGPALFGRVAQAQATERFQAEGAWGISPHLVPNASLHALSGTISLALRAHGPNFSVEAGPHSCAGVFLAAAALMGQESLPGLWLVATGFRPEFVPTPGRAAPGAQEQVEALAVAFQSTSAGAAGQCRWYRDAGPANGLRPLSLASLVDHVQSHLTVGRWRLGADMCWEMTQPARAAA